tara:strand:- start:56 stop:1024 length:969 start_codon:yes stop_codon:yes gene_type:complete
MTLIIEKGDCLKLMKELPDASIDLFICDLPYVDINGNSETNCKWNQSAIDMDKFWEQFRRLRKSKRTACIHFCSTKFGYSLIKSWEAGYKMDMVWKKRNKTGGLQSKHRPMRNHEMVYFFYEQSPKYNRDKYHKRLKAAEPEHKTKNYETKSNETQGQKKAKDWGYEKCSKSFKNNEQVNDGRRMGANYEPPNPVSVMEEKSGGDIYGEEKESQLKRSRNAYIKTGNVNKFDPVNPASVVEDEPVSMFESTKVFIGKRHHQTEKPQDILEFFLKYWTDEGDTVLDPTMGSGSTGVACKKLNRDFIGFEKDKNIFKVAESRLK